MKMIKTPPRLHAVICVLLSALLLTVGFPLHSFAASDFSRSLLVGEYTVWRNGKPSASSVEKGDQLSITAPVLLRGVTAGQTGKISITAESDSFRLPEGCAAVEVLPQEGNTLPLKVSFTDLTYRGRGNSIRFRLTDEHGVSDEGSVDLEECVEERRGRKDDDGEKRPKRETLYGAPPLLVSSEPLPELLRPGQEFTLKVGLRNLSPRLSAFNLMLSFSASDGVTIAEATSSRYIQSLHSMKEKFVNVRLRANREIENPAQSLTVNVKYEYIENDQRSTASAEERLNLAFDPETTGSRDVVTPNVIISKFDYGKQIAVGDTFALALSLKNTNLGQPIENLVMTLEPGEGFAFVNSSNTFYYPGMAAGGKIDQAIQVRALPPFSNAKPDYKIECSFKYEYVAGGKRAQVTSSERLSFPVYYPDRFEISPPDLSEAAVEGAEMTISLPYVNKGKAEISNVEAELEGEIDALDKHQNLGNFEAGKSGTIDFIVRPLAGEAHFTVKIRYEDSNMEIKTLEYPISFQVDEAAPVFDPDEMDVTPEPPAWRKLLAPVALFTILVAACVLLYYRKRKKIRAIPELSTAWDEPAEMGGPDEQK